MTSTQQTIRTEPHFPLLHSQTRLPSVYQRSSWRNAETSVISGRRM